MIHGLLEFMDRNSQTVFPVDGLTIFVDFRIFGGAVCLTGNLFIRALCLMIADFSNIAAVLGFIV